MTPPPGASTPSTTRGVEIDPSVGRAYAAENPAAPPYGADLRVSVSAWAAAAWPARASRAERLRPASAARRRRSSAPSSGKKKYFVILRGSPGVGPPHLAGQGATSLCLALLVILQATRPYFTAGLHSPRQLITGLQLASSVWKNGNRRGVRYGLPWGRRGASSNVECIWG